MSKVVLLILALYLGVVSAQLLGPTCAENETMGCASCTGEPTCQNPIITLEPRPCTLECKLICACNEGFIRDTLSEKCVLKKNCP
ncbi:hypothetical protein JTB14_016852 [Gonioctena quinquepunctata]|nr:hypothetical protein JTB14_016852 [Gonioctena quinquepunctata]